MENSSNMSESTEKVKNILLNMKNPVKFNLSKINEMLDLFDKTSIALLNPIKKLKISCSEKINTLKELEEKGLKNIEHGDGFIFNRHKSDDNTNIIKSNGKSSTSIQDIDINKFNIDLDDKIINLLDDREEENYNDQVEIKSKYQNIFNDFYDNIKILKNLFGTQEFNKLKSFSENLNCKKKSGRENIALNLNNNINENYTNMVGVHFDSQKNGKANKKIKELVELSPNPEKSLGDKNVFDDIFDNNNNEEEITKSFNSEMEDDMENKSKKKAKNIISMGSANNSKKSTVNWKSAGNNVKINGSKNGNIHNNSLLKKKVNRAVSNFNNKNKTKSQYKFPASVNNLGKNGKPSNNINIANGKNVLFSNTINLDTPEITAHIEIEENENKANNIKEKEKDIVNISNDKYTESLNGRKLTEEECLVKMLERLPHSQGLTKTFISRKLRKKVMISRLLEYKNNYIGTVKNVETTIPKKSGPNNFIKFSMKISNDDEFKINSILKKNDNQKKIIIAGSITKDIIFFLKKIANAEFRDKYSIISAKVKAYAFYEELIYEFHQRNDITTKNLTQEDIDNFLKQFEYLNHMRSCYEDVLRLRVKD